MNQIVKEDRIIASLERMRIPKRFWYAKLEKINSKQLPYIVRFIRKEDRGSNKGYGMVLWGENDTGKTAAACVALREIRFKPNSRHDCFFITSEDYIDAVMQGNSYNESISIEQRAKEVDLLALDDLGKEHMDKYEFATIERKIENLIRTRSSNYRSTIITTNLDLDAMRERYSKSLRALMKEAFIFLKMDGPSLRDEERNQMLRFFEED